MIVITTPTGQIGSQIIERALEAGEAVRVVARDPARLDPGVRERVEVVAGSHGDRDVLSRALDGADAVFWVVPPDFRVEDFMAYYRDFTAPAAELIAELGVPRVVAVSSLGREVARGVGLVAAAYAMDGLLERAGSAYRALRMPAFMEDVALQQESIAREGVFYGAQTADLPVPSCATRDIAAVGAALLLDRSWTGTGSAPVLGPEDLSFDDLAAIMSDVLGRPVRYRQLSAGDYCARLMSSGMGRAYARGLTDNQVEASRGIYNAEPRTAASTTPTTFRQWCTEVLRPALQDRADDRSSGRTS